MAKFPDLLGNWLNGVYMPKIQIIDLLEILILAFLIYICIVWIQRTRAYTLLKGFLFVIAFVAIASVLRMSVILWITQNIASIALIALVIIFQPELRKALESLGNRNFVSSFFRLDSSDKNQLFTDQTITEIVRAVNEMSEVRTGALIEQIFEHNTPLHDGAVIRRGDKILAATCYLPLSDNVRINKKYGTRHRAGLGISEVSDSFTIIVSEETGRVSYAYMGELTTGVTASELREQLHQIQKRGSRTDKNDTGRLRFRRGGSDE